MLLSEGQSAENFASDPRASIRSAAGSSPPTFCVRFDSWWTRPSLTGETLTLDGGQRFLRLPRDVQFLEPDTLMTDVMPFHPAPRRHDPVQRWR